MSRQFPSFPSDAAARCFQCAGALTAHGESGYYAGAGARRGYCERCGLDTWYDVAVPDRRFLTRGEATYLLGLMDAAQRREPPGVVVACRDPRTGEVFEAESGEVLHAQIALRVRRPTRLQDGWTIERAKCDEIVATVRTA